MNSAEKQRILAAYDRASLMASLANRGFYVIGEVWRDRVWGQPPGAADPAGPPAPAGHDPQEPFRP